MLDVEMDGTMFDMLGKVSLALFGGALGAFLKTYSDKSRLRALSPIVLEVTQEAAVKCTQAFCIADAKAIEPSLDTAFRNMAEIVGLGIRPVKAWQEGISFVQQTSLAVKKVIAAQDEKAAIQELTGVRDKASELLHWSKQMKS